MSATIDLDVAKDRLVDSLSSARDITVTAVKDDIGPAVVAAVGAAREASAPVYAEAASRASDAVSALRGSEAAKALAATGTDAAKKLRAGDLKGLRVKPKPSHRKRWTLLAALAGLGVAGAVFKSRKKPANDYPGPSAGDPTSID